MFHAFRNPFIIKARFKNGEGLLFTGQDLYAFALLRSPDDMYFFVDLVDDGLEYDGNPNDGTYIGTIHFEEIYRKLLEKKMKLDGVWRAYVFAQDVNDATPDMLPVDAAKRVGGAMIASGLQLTFDPSLPCPLEAQVSFTVIV